MSVYGREKQKPLVRHIIIVCLLCSFSMSLCGRSFEGCWRSEKTGEWAIGLFEHFAVYQTKCWNYEAIEKKGKSSRYILRHGDQRLEIRMKQRNDLVCGIRIGSGKEYIYTRLMSRCLPDYPVFDDSAFLHTSYEQDSVTITGYVRNMPDNFSSERTTANDQLSDNHWSETIRFDSLGRFSLRVPVRGVQRIFLLNTPIIAEPGETYFLFFDFSTGQKYVMGNNARATNEFLAFDPPYISIPEDAATNNAEYMRLHKEKEAFAENLLQTYIACHPQVSKRFRYLAAQYLKYTLASGLMERYYELKNRAIGEHFDASIINYVDSAYLSVPVTPYTLVSDFNTFLRYYVEYKEYEQSFSSGMGVIPYIFRDVLLRYEAEEGFHIPDSVRAMLHTLVEIPKRIRSGKLSPGSEQFLALHSSVLKTIRPFLLSGPISSHSTRIWKETCLLQRMAVLDTLQMDTHLKEYQLARSVCSLLNSDHTSFSSSMMELLRPKITNLQLWRVVSQLNDKYSKDMNSFDFQNCLKTNETLQGLVDGKAIFNKIIEPLRGSVVYVDVWGSWCSPCKRDMKDFAPEIKKLLADKNVVFLYLANRTSTDSWKQLIREYNSVGPRVVHYNLPPEQQTLVEKYLEVKFYPSYRLVDKKGSVIPRQIPSPQAKEELLKIVTEQLDK